MERNPSLSIRANSRSATKAHSAFAFLFGCTLLVAATGCYSYNPYGYGGGGYMNPYGGMPPATVAPGSTSIQPPSGAFIAPGDFSAQPSLSQQPTQVLQPRQWQNSKAGPAPGAEVFEQPKSDNNVPDYLDPNGSKTSSPSATQGEGNEFSPFESSQRSGDGTDPSLLEKIDVADNSVVLGEPIADEEFAKPVPMKSVSSTRTVGKDQDDEELPNPYGHRNDYGWLRGVVDFDETDKSWHIIYNMTPDSSDAYGGGLTLIGHPDLKYLKTNDVVLVRGQIDTTSLDHFGKPSYRIKRIERLVLPKKN